MRRSDGERSEPSAAEPREGEDAACVKTGRGRLLVTECVIPSAPPDRFDDVIATADGQPIWVTICTGRVRHDTCWISDSWIKPGDCVFQHLNGSRFMNLLPLLEWLRSISGGAIFLSVNLAGSN